MYEANQGGLAPAGSLSSVHVQDRLLDGTVGERELGRLEQTARVEQSRRAPARGRRVRQAIRSALAGVALATFTFSGVALANSPSYTVQGGDSLSEIAARLGVRSSDLAAANDLANPDLLQVGQVLRVPDADQGRAAPSSRGDRPAPVLDVGPSAPAVAAARSPFVMPARGPITTYFGEPGPLWRLGYHPGLDIGVPLGTQVWSCGEGVVIEAEASGWNSGYGHYVKVDHGNGLHSLYAHLSTVSVSVGDRVTGGTIVGRIGMTGVTTGPHLHWEIRQDGVKKDPLAYLK